MVKVYVITLEISEYPCKESSVVKVCSTKKAANQWMSDHAGELKGGSSFSYEAFKVDEKIKSL